MATVTDQTIDTLNELIETCKDGENGYENAAKHAKRNDLKILFTELSQQRAQFASELQAEVRRLGGEEEKSGTTAASMHRGWMDVRSAFTGDDDHAMLSECERGEDSAVEAYEKALKEELTSDARTLVQRQHSEVRRAHDRIKALRDATD